MYPNSTHHRAYQAIARAQAVFQRRMRQIEVELAEAQHALEKFELEPPLSPRQCKLALAMAHHPRLGQDSPLRVLPEDLLRAIAEEAGRI